MADVVNFGDERIGWRFWEKLVPEPNTGCWIWLGHTASGVPRRMRADRTEKWPVLHRKSGTVLVHRFLYRELICAIPDDRRHDLRNRCGMPRCCNPAHYVLDEVKSAKRAELKRKGLWNVRKRRSATLKYKYGITIDDFERMQGEQQSRCAICLAEFIEFSKIRVDHCHATGRVRALLCHGCNVGLGSFREDPERLRAAAEYVARHAAHLTDVKIGGES